MTASGKPSRRPRATGAQRRRSVAVAAVIVAPPRSTAGPRRRTRAAAPATVASTPRAIAAIVEADRRVTASPENAAIDAPRNASAPNVSSSARNGSARTATNPRGRARSAAATHRAGPAPDPERRSSQPAASVAATRIATLIPNAGPSTTSSAEQSEGEGADQQAPGDGSVQWAVLQAADAGRRRSTRSKGTTRRCGLWRSGGPVPVPVHGTSAPAISRFPASAGGRGSASVRVWNEQIAPVTTMGTLRHALRGANARTSSSGRSMPARLWI